MREDKFENPLEIPDSDSLACDGVGAPTAASRGRRSSIDLRADALGCRLAFSVREVADILGISEKSVRRLISRGLMGTSRALRHHLIPRKEIEKFLDRTTV